MQKVYIVRDWIYRQTMVRSYMTMTLWPITPAATSQKAKPQPLQAIGSEWSQLGQWPSVSLPFVATSNSGPTRAGQICHTSSPALIATSSFSKPIASDRAHLEPSPVFAQSFTTLLLPLNLSIIRWCDRLSCYSKLWINSVFFSYMGGLHFFPQWYAIT